MALALAAVMMAAASSLPTILGAGRPGAIGLSRLFSAGAIGVSVLLIADAVFDI